MKLINLCLVAILVLTVSAAFAAESSATSLASSQDSWIEQWPSHCAQLKVRFSDSPAAATVTYTPLPALPAGAAPVWKLQWQGLDVPIPALPYTHISVSDGQQTLMLATDDLQFVSIGRSHTPRQSPMIQSLWGKDASLLDVMAYGYSVTPDDLSCAKGEVKQQARTATALILKTVASPVDLLAAHEVAGWERGLLTYGRSHGVSGMDAYAYLLRERQGQPPYDIRYRLAAAATGQSRTALLLAQPEAASFTAGPAWLQKLQGWLDEPNDEQLCALADALRVAGFDADNVREIVAHTSSCQTETG